MSLPFTVLARAFLRSLFIQAAWNRRGMQNLGFAYAIAPVIAALYQDVGQRREALRRHMGFFNCHPYMAAAILGGAIHHELRAAAGQEPSEQVTAYKQTLQGPLAAIGDGFFWTALRPFFGALAALGTLLVGWPALLTALILYNGIHLAMRIGFFRAGYRLGDAVVEFVSRQHLPVVADRLRLAAAMLCGLSAATVVLSGAGLSGPPAAIVAATAAALGYLALARGAKLLPSAYVAALAGIAVAVVTGRGEILMARLERTFTVVNMLGLHARAAAQLVQVANRHRCEVTVVKDGIQVNGKSIMGVLTLAAAKGTTITVVCDGEDAEHALAALAKLIEAGFGER